MHRLRPCDVGIHNMYVYSVYRVFHEDIQMEFQYY